MVAVREVVIDDGGGGKTMFVDDAKSSIGNRRHLIWAWPTTTTFIEVGLLFLNSLMV
jgi:hypothetical protein